MNTYKDELWLYHHGVKGQKWGVRRYQNTDGSLTAAGKKRYSTENINALKKQIQKYEKSGDKKSAKAAAKELKKVERERDYIDRDYALTKLVDKSFRGLDPYSNHPLQRPELHAQLNRKPFTLNPNQNIRNQREIWKDWANKKVGEIKTPTGRTVEWVNKEYYWRPIKSWKESRGAATRNFNDFIHRKPNITGVKPVFKEKKG